MSIPITLQAPSTDSREAIVDALYRTVLSFDTGDVALFNSAFFPDATFTFGDNVMEGRQSIHDNSFANIAKLDTTHFINNVRVSLVEGASNKATITASALAQHYRAGEGNKPGATRLMSGALYFLDVEKHEGDGLWKVRKWVMKLVWTEGDWGVMKGE
ncbi:hypothetical protein BO94DRAFT_148728 [Aspergillus sclerotioniger CBS 115572]|uniref:SnoaL-like domain-containing protein n=1 Tax=Aspergillus sclerotioniger CBS 115572 TaxID=1450535 RepID=A0A317W6S2_9EURO|nr:hypothetical protein BO94DRAFT_148728 [Aspergillus sclerotioniger CBS 115572]PWY81749.1 hypothetical protein BO94DRAFT_148728 [Aspergillus sclerotioniger CBS 115572]